MDKHIAFFDFDGTITEKDSLVDFIQFVVGKKRYYLGLFLLSPILVCYVFKLIPNFKAKEKLISHFFKGWEKKHFQEKASEYSMNQIDKITRSKAIEKINWHRDNNHVVVIVSASMESWLKAWCVSNDIALISTRLEFKDQKLTGKFATINCYGKEKVNRIKERYELDKYKHIYAYGDSLGDREMLNLAHSKYFKPFTS